MLIRHKLLSQLGQISHFLIRALARRELNLEQLAAITALQIPQLAPIHQRLVDLQIIQDQRLSTTGKRYAYYLQYLHGTEASFWLDSCYRRPPVLISAGNPAVGDIPEEMMTTDSEGSSRKGTAEESALQLERLKYADERYGWLPWLFPQFVGAQPESWTEWEIDLQVPPQLGASQGIALTIPLLDAALVRQPAATIYTPLLHLSTRYTTPEGLLFNRNVALPPDQNLYFDYFSEQIIENPGSFFEDGEFENRHVPRCSKGDGIAALKQYILERLPEDAETALFNRQYSTSSLWRALALSWVDVVRRLAECGDNWWVRRSDAGR